MGGNSRAALEIVACDMTGGRAAFAEKNHFFFPIDEARSRTKLRSAGWADQLCIAMRARRLPISSCCSLVESPSGSRKFNGNETVAASALELANLLCVPLARTALRVRFACELNPLRPCGGSAGELVTQLARLRPPPKPLGLVR
ncbi:Hypothetical predicted protein [Olea europaea subsp. europaea]|uniref:Uncharacterized protein n=1 Tax=Olea europaea subsp. europaea TaxID=158383 RepID=A0A8S0TM91_OLEEU|nr:Hypothetical predicted protein [Olea europaea subsp. europaea]